MAENEERSDEPEIIERADPQRFEMKVDGDVAFMNYRREGRKLYLLHTEVPPALRGKNVGTRFVRGVLARARAEGAIVVAHCPFVRAYLAKHPEEKAQARNPPGSAP